MFQFCDLKPRKHYTLQKEVSVSNEELPSLVDSLSDLPKTFDEASHCLLIHLRKFKIEIRSRKEKKTSLLISKKITVIIQKDNFVYPSVLETANLTLFPSKTWKCAAIIQYLQNLSTIAKFMNLRRTNVRLQTVVKLLRAIAICSIFNPECQYDQSLVNLIENVFCRKKMCSGKRNVVRLKICSISRQKWLSMSSMRVLL